MLKWRELIFWRIGGDDDDDNDDDEHDVGEEEEEEEEEDYKKVAMPGVAVVVLVTKITGW